MRCRENFAWRYSDQIENLYQCLPCKGSIRVEEKGNGLTMRVSGYKMTLGKAYLTFSSKASAVSGEKSEVKTTGRTKADPVRREERGSSGPSIKAVRKRLNKYLKLICSLEDGEYLESKLWFRTGEKPDMCKSRLTKFKDAFRNEFPDWFYIWKLRVRMMTGGKIKPFAHLLIGSSKELDLERYRTWAKRYWSKNTRVSEGYASATKITNELFSYFHDDDDARKLLPFISMMRTVRWTHGKHNKKIIPLMKEKETDLTESQMEVVRQILREELERQAAEYKDGEINLKQLARIDGEAAFQAFLTKRVWKRIEAVLAPGEDALEGARKIGGEGERSIEDKIRDAILSPDAVVVLEKQELEEEVCFRLTNY